MAYSVFRVGDNEHQRVEKLNRLQQGKMNASSLGTVTLEPDEDTTTLTDPLITADSLIVLFAATESASQDEGSSHFWVDGHTNGSATINHLNRPDVDRTFRYAVIG